MPKYDLDCLGDVEFEHLIQTLLKVVIGNGTTTFGNGPDGGREATYHGKAPYPSISEHWSGFWIFQVKFHDTKYIGLDKAREQILQDLRKSASCSALRFDSLFYVPTANFLMRDG